MAGRVFNGIYRLQSREWFVTSIYLSFWSAFGERLELAPIVAEIKSSVNSAAARELLLALACRYENAAELYQSFRGPPPILEQHPALQHFYQRIRGFWLADDILSHSMNKVAGFLASKDSDQAQSFRFLNLCSNLRLRRTTEPADEAITMAALLDADLQKVLNSDGKHRMSVLLRSLETVPSALIFFQGERYEADGLRWIPKSFLLWNGRLGSFWGYFNNESPLQQQGRPQREGLLVNFPGLRLLHPPKSNSPERCYLANGNAKYVLILTEGNRLKLARTDWATYADRELAVILSTTLDDVSMPALGGVLVSRRKVNNGVYYARFEHTVYLHRAENAIQKEFFSIKIDWPGQTGQEDYTPIQVLPSTQDWCMG